MLNIFCGYDERESVGYHIFCQSVLSRSSIPVAFTPLQSNGMRQGTNAFTTSRFSVPALMGYKGRAVFADAADMVMLCDAKELQDALNNLQGAVGVVKHNYSTKNPIKYIGTELESPNTNYPRKNWASFMLINCEHPAWQKITPEYLQIADKMYDLLQLSFIDDSDIQEIDDSWNRIVDEDQPLDGAKIVHWTAGIPGFKHYQYAVGADIWQGEWINTAYPMRTL
jgi:hypothetical protein